MTIEEFKEIEKFKKSTEDIELKKANIERLLSGGIETGGPIGLYFNGDSIEVSPDTIFSALQLEYNWIEKRLQSIRDDFRKRDGPLYHSHYDAACALIKDMDKTTAAIERFNKYIDNLSRPSEIFISHISVGLNAASIEQIDRTVYIQALYSQLELHKKLLFDLQTKFNNL